MQQVTVNVDIGLSQRESEAYLASIIESGILNHVRTPEEKKRLFEQYPTLKDGMISIVKKSSFDDTRLNHIFMNVAPYDKQNEFIKQGIKMLDVINKWISKNKENINNVYLMSYDGRLELRVERTDVRYNEKFEQKLIELQLDVAKQFNLIKLRCHPLPKGDKFIPEDAFQLYSKN